MTNNGNQRERMREAMRRELKRTSMEHPATPEEGQAIVDRFADAALAIQPQAEAQPGVGEDYEIGKRDGYEEAVQDIDLLTGGDGEYVCAPGAGSLEAHCPTPDHMKLRIKDRFDRLTPAMSATPAQPAGDVRERVARAITDVIRLAEKKVARGGKIGPATEAHIAKAYKTADRILAALSATPAQSGWRPEVKAFADLMEAKLREHDARKGAQGWKGMHWQPLLDMLGEHLHKFDDRLQSAQGPAQAGRDAADIANLAMMIADVCGALPQNEGPK